MDSSRAETVAFPRRFGKADETPGQTRRRRTVALLPWVVGGPALWTYRQFVGLDAVATPLALAALAVASLALLGRGVRQRLVVHPWGVSEHFLCGRARRHRRESLRALNRGDDRVEVITEKGLFTITDDFPEWASAVALVEARWRGEPPLGRTIAPEQIEAWLGVERGGVLVVKSGWRWLRVRLPALLETPDLAAVVPRFTILLLLGIPVMLSRSAALQVGFAAVSFVILIAFNLSVAAARPHHYRADGHGLEITRCSGRQLPVAWHELRGVRHLHHGLYQVATTQGDFTLLDRTPDDHRLLHACQQAVAAQRAEEDPRG